MSFRVATQAIQTGGRADDGDRSVYTGFSANRTGGLGNQEPLNAETVRLADTFRRICDCDRQIEAQILMPNLVCCVAATGGEPAGGTVLPAAVPSTGVRAPCPEESAVATQ